MFPDSVAAVLGFLFVVAPGLVFEAVRERRRPTIDRSTFREVSSVAVASLVLSSVALLFIAGVRFLWPAAFPDFTVWLRDGTRYIIRHVPQVAIFLGIWAVFAALTATLSARVLFRTPAKIDAHTTAWFEVFRKRKPAGTRPMALVQLEDGRAYAGEVVYYDAHVLLKDRELILGPPLWHRSGPEEQLVPLPQEQDWRRVVIPGARLSALWVRYPPEDAQPQQGSESPRVS